MGPTAEDLRRLAELAASSHFGAAATRCAVLPRDFDGRNTAASTRLSLPVREKRTPAAKAAQCHGVQVQVGARRAGAHPGSLDGESRLLIDLEGHGREAPFSDLDLSRTVGWFTSLFPLTLDLGETADPPWPPARSAASSARYSPRIGLRRPSLSGRRGDRPNLRRACRSGNQLQLSRPVDQTLARPADLALTLEPVGPLRSPAGLRFYVIGSAPDRRP